MNETAAACIDAAQQLAARGKPVTRSAVLEVVKVTANIKSPSTVARYWPQVLSALAEGGLPIYLRG